ncbi:fluoride efflux transporter FluC [Alkalicaulis satelles]|nr:CrcB family protein [Alkalicaulis satelles]
MQWLLIMLGGALGAAARLWAAGAVQRLAGGAFPMGTLAVNISGAALLGVLAGAFAGAGETALSAVWAFFAIGLLGSYTTVSAFTLDTLGLLKARRLGLAVLNMAASFALSLLAAAGGYALGAAL